MISRKGALDAIKKERRELRGYMLRLSAELIEGSVGKQTELGSRGDYGVRDLERQWAAARHRVRVGYGLSLIAQFSDSGYEEVVLVRRKRGGNEENQP